MAEEGSQVIVYVGATACSVAVIVIVAIAIFCLMRSRRSER